MLPPEQYFTGPRARPISFQIKLTAMLPITSPQKQSGPLGSEQYEYYSIIAAIAETVNG